MDIQSNSIRGDVLKRTAVMTAQEIMQDIMPMFGPGASDAFVINEGTPYYTRDGMEVMKSLTFDNELARYIHHIFFQAAYHQGKKVGDGSTTVLMLYTHLYLEVMKAMSDKTAIFQGASINTIRSKWKVFTENIVAELKKRAVPLTEDRLLSMLYTCTQDSELAVKLYDELKEPIMAGAYIMPRKSNIATDLKVTSHTRPLFKVTRQFSLRHVGDTIENAIVMYCNGMLDIGHDEIFAGLATRRMAIGPVENKQYKDLSYVILCTGLTDRTRKSLKSFIQVAKDNQWDIPNLNNIVIYTMNEARVLMPEEIEDITTIITEEKGIGGLVNAITFEHYLYHAFVDCNALGFDPIKELETFDIDPHLVDKMKELAYRQWRIIIDDIEGIALDGILGPVAEERHRDLLEQIRNEKTAVKREELNHRLRRTFGQFIDVEVGSTLLKDSQRKFELILDALLSSSEAAKNGVLEGNSILHVLSILHAEDSAKLFADSDGDNSYGFVLAFSLMWVAIQLVKNMFPEDNEDDINNVLYNALREQDKYEVKDFNVYRALVWPEHKDVIPMDPIIVHRTDGDEDAKINPEIMEPVGIMSAIIENSMLPIELAKMKVFHISGQGNFMGNYIDQPDEDCLKG